MTEVYWITGTSLQISDEMVVSGTEQNLACQLIPAVLKSVSARAEWVDQFLWMYADLESLNAAGCAVFREAIDQKPLLKWVQQAGLPHYLLHALSRSILAGDCKLAVMVQSEQFSGSASLLASPKAVGRYNLLPQARIMERWEINFRVEGLEGLIHRILERIENNNRHSSEVQLVSWQSTSDVFWEAFSRVFLNARRCTNDLSGEKNILFRLNAFVAQLEEEALDNGLLISWDDDELVAVSWIERV